MLQPLGDRILIRPEENPTQTESGLHLVEEAQPETSGVVVAVGNGIPHPRRDEALEMARDVIAADSMGFGYDTNDIAAMLRELTASKPLVAVGDTVLFSYKAGQEIQIEGEPRYLIMRESDILAILEGVTL